jgi:hypothetical protein
MTAYLTSEQFQQVRALSFVEKVEPVVTYRKKDKAIEDIIQPTPLPEVSKTNGVHLLKYGPSLTQVEQIKVPAVHDVGIVGRGILAGMLDDGFNNHKTHEALKNLPVLVEYDFIYKDSNTTRTSTEPLSQGNHGASTMSTLGGYMPGQLISPGFGATFVLGKTEDDRGETRVEEDNWAAGIEWMEGLGDDLVSSSLG